MKIYIAIILVSLAAIVGEALGQQYASQDGHLLDANNRVGSMGWNGNARMDALSYRNNSLMTGNITGGLSFQGSMQYTSSRQFQGLSRSDTLSNFRRDSVSVSRLGSGGPQVYYDQSRSTTGTYGGGVSQSYQGYSTSRIMNPSSSRTTYTQQYNTSLNYQPQSAQKFSLDKYLGSSAGLNQSGSRTGPAGIASDVIGRPGLGYSITTRNEYNDINSGLGYNQAAKQREAEAAKPDATQLKIDTENLGNAGRGEAETPVDVEEQMYMDPESSKRIFVEGGMQSTGLSTDKQITDQMQKKYAAYMSSGKKSLANGKYYDAVDSFELAKIFTRRNKLEPLFYCMIARFAAGEYISSASNLSHMFYISFEKTMQDRDLEKIFGDDNIIGKNMIDISANYDANGNSTLLFLRGYIEYLSGDLERAKSSFAELVENNPGNELFADIQAALK